MKSVIVQGATVAKAIDEALIKAGMPIEFFIKILEEAQPGFLGFGSKKAKIALFFKREQGRREGSLLSRGSYKDLFENENLQAQPVDQAKQGKVVEKKETVPPVVPQPRKVEAQQHSQQRKIAQVTVQPNKNEIRQQPSRIENPPKKADAIVAPKVHQESQKPFEQKLIVQRPLGQRPLRFNNSKKQDAVSVLTPVEAAGRQEETLPSKDINNNSLQQNNNLSAEQKDAAQEGSLQNKRPRRRSRYGYRSKAPIQWGKSQDDTESQSGDGSKDPGSK